MINEPQVPTLARRPWPTCFWTQRRLPKRIGLDLHATDDPLHGEQIRPEKMHSGRELYQL